MTFVFIACIKDTALNNYVEINVARAHISVKGVGNTIGFSMTCAVFGDAIHDISMEEEEALTVYSLTSEELILKARAFIGESKHEWLIGSDALAHRKSVWAVRCGTCCVCPECGGARGCCVCGYMDGVAEGEAEAE